MHTARVVDIDAYNRLHFPSFPSGSLDGLVVSYTSTRVVYSYSSSLGVTGGDHL
jgi:hypothetical protein